MPLLLPHTPAQAKDLNGDSPLNLAILYGATELALRRSRSVH